MKDIINERLKLFKLAKERTAEEHPDKAMFLIDNFLPVPEAEMEKKPIYYLGRSIQMMAEADYVLFAKDWHLKRGCIIEHEIAEAYGKRIIYEDENDWKGPL